MEAWRLEACEIAAKVRKGELRAREVAECVLARLKETDEKVKAYVSFDAGKALARADAIDRAVAEGEDPGALCGVPVAVKDNMCLAGGETTCSSRILEGFRPPFTATAVKKLIEAGAVIVGKTNMDEFAMGSSCENSAFFPTRNPWDLSRVPGGSSGGSAAAVACGSAVAALGSDTGGSIRQPASLCGVVGFKPTYGRVSRYGLVAFGSSLDQIGPLTRSVRDCALLSRVVSGHDQMDATSFPSPVEDYLASLDGTDLRGVRLGVPKEYFVGGVQPEVEESVREAASVFRSLGAEVKEMALPHTEYAVAVYYIVATAEASSNLARYDGVHYGHRTSSPGGIVETYSQTRAEGFGREVKRRIMLGTFALSSGYYDAYYLKALKVRNLIKADFDRAWEEVDYILAPTSPTVAFRLGERMTDPLSMYLSDVYTIPANLAALPAISVPCGFSGEGLPIGLQIMGRRLDEKGVLRAAAAFEKARSLEPRAPVDPRG